MAWLGEALPDSEQDSATPFATHCVKDLIEERLFQHRRDLFARLDLVFVDTTSLAFEGQGGQTLGQRGYSKDHRRQYSEVKSRLLFQCAACRRQTSVSAGTIFASTKLPLPLGFRALYHLTQSKQGISRIEPGRRRGVTRTTAWTIRHKLQQIMLERDATQRLSGRVERDDADLGGARPGGKRGRGAAGKTPFGAAVETTREGKPV